MTRSNVIPYALAILLALLILANLADSARGAPTPDPYLTPMEWAVGMCETKLNWKHRTRDYQGAFGFYSGSWDAFRPAGYPTEAYNATPRQQTVVMRRIRARYGWTGWGCVTNGGYRHWIGRRG